MRTVFNLDMSMMIAIHDAFRRDLELVARMTGRSDGWDRFEKLLHLHHRAEDDALWPVVRDALAGQPEDLAFVDEMESQHAALGPLVAAIDASFERGEPAPLVRAELDTLLRAHLADEEARALPLIDRTLSADEWMQFGAASVAIIGPAMPLFLPWLLDGADTDFVDSVLGRMPEAAQVTYWSEWQPAYAAKQWWDPNR